MTPWITFVNGLVAGLAAGYGLAARAHGRRLRRFCHFEAANLVDSRERKRR